MRIENKDKDYYRKAYHSAHHRFSVMGAILIILMVVLIVLQVRHMREFAFWSELGHKQRVEIKTMQKVTDNVIATDSLLKTVK